MLSNYWLLSDLDGTLLSTPHKAKGKYLPITSSPCFEPLQRWLTHGGNVCVVTTADTRVLQQLYLPLRKYLVGCRLPGRKDVGPCRCGTLLLSFYTGAVLYRCSAEDVVMVPHYIDRFHRATEESTQQCAAFGVKQPIVLFQEDTHGIPERVRKEAAVKGTCINGSTGEIVRELVCQLYMSYIEDILQGKPNVISKIQDLSRRYKTMWKKFLTFLHQAYFLENSCGTSGVKKIEVNPFHPVSYQPSPPAVVQWIMTYLRSRCGLLLVLGILRIEFAETVAFSSSKAAPLSGTSEVASTISGVLLNGLSEPHKTRLRSAAQQFSNGIASLLGVEEKELERAFSISGRSGQENGIAQMILLGFPLSLYSTYFTSRVPQLIQAGVHCMPQPNSVVFSKLGISKSTALRYVLGKCVEHRQAPGEAEDFAGIVTSCNAVSLGDNPQSTDYELTVFPDVYFVSIEKHAQRSERHRRIHRRLSRTAERERLQEPNLLPDGRPAPSLDALLESTHNSGPMMDDRLCKNILYVGGEEDGTAVFLTALMNGLNVPNNVPFGGCTRQVVEREFRQAVLLAQSEAFQKMASQSLGEVSKL